MHFPSHKEGEKSGGGLSTSPTISRDQLLPDGTNCPSCFCPSLLVSDLQYVVVYVHV